MEWDEFRKWLEGEKTMSHRSALDVLSRVRRALSILDDKTIDSGSISKIRECEEINMLSVSVRSQIKRAIVLYVEFLHE